VKTPEHGEHWGLLGGAFDPVHSGHINLASKILDTLNLSGIIFIPSFSHPFKNDNISSSFEHRVVMLDLACKKHINFIVTNIEENLSGYTIDTVRKLKELYPQTEFTFIVGTDSLSQLNQWREPDEIIREVNLVAGTRPGHEFSSDNCFSDKIQYIEIAEIDISSSQLRKMISSSMPDDELKKYIDEDVLSYIKTNKLYQ
jgi:nicotinate-nucleotide adenylyltransferase